jgi:hypothetical protein
VCSSDLNLTDRSFTLKHGVEPIKSYWNDLHNPPSRGNGIRPHRMESLTNPRRMSTGMVMGRGKLHENGSYLPPALHSQPYGANFHFQFQLPPQYSKFNSGGDDLGY